MQKSSQHDLTGGDVQYGRQTSYLGSQKPANAGSISLFRRKAWRWP